MIKIKDIYELQGFILRSGYNFSSFANEIGISRSALNKIFKRATISAPNAKKVSTKLDKQFDDIFLIFSCPKEHEKNRNST